MQLEFNAATFAEALNCTGIVEPVRDLSVDVPRGQERPQARSANNVPLWDVEFMQVIEEFGRQRTDVGMVRVEAPSKPTVKPGPTKFADLSATVSTRTNRVGSGRNAQITGVTERIYWRASGVEPQYRQSERAAA